MRCSPSAFRETRAGGVVLHAQSLCDQRGLIGAVGAGRPDLSFLQANDVGIDLSEFIHDPVDTGGASVKVPGDDAQARLLRRRSSLHLSQRQNRQ